MSSPVCSVVIPAYNAAGTIGQQLEALAAQVGAPDFEIVVADNGSTDGLAGAVDGWRTVLEQLRIVDASRAQGVSVARNVGIEHAQSDQILICDADDVVSASWVRAMVEALHDGPLVSGPVSTTLLSGRSAAWVPVASRTTSLFETWGGRTYGIGCNLGLRKEVWRAVGGFDESYPSGAEEIDFAWRADALGYRFAYAEDALVHYRIRTDLPGVLRQQFNSGRGASKLYATFRPPEVRPKSLGRRVRHELLLLRRYPWRGGSDARRMWLSVVAFEVGKLVEARRLKAPAP